MIHISLTDKDVATNDSKYVQQHLANERTFLAWVRTGIAMAGIGFLAAGFGFNSSAYDRLAHIAAIITGITSLIGGISIIVYSAVAYHRKRTQINEQTFQASTGLIRFLTMMLLVIGLALAVLLYVLLFPA
ncbi:YidH family protein [Paenibacillus xylanexedens]|uniref:YidH family protein n=1 Tax=Paenibacillus xylanexedens TaxID=528191 RepID=UPI003CFFB62C